MYDLSLFVFCDHGIKYQDSICNGCHDWLVQCIDISNIITIIVKGANYCCTIHDISKCDVIFLSENSVLDDSGYILNASQRNQY